MKPRKSVDQWRVTVFRSAAISDAVRVYLLRLADHMKADRTVSVPRTQLARELGRHEQRVAERTKAAIDAGLLTTVSAGYKGHTAVYQGTFPDPVGAAKGTDLQYAKESLERYALGSDCIPDGEYTTSKRPPSGSAVANVPNGEQRGGAGRQSGAVVRAAVDRLGDESTDRRRSA